MSGKSIEQLASELDEKEKNILDPKLIQGPEDVYAQYFTLYMPMFKNYVNRLSQKALRRVTKALVEYPLNEKDFHHSTEEEKNAILIGEKLLHAKQMMILHTLSEHYKNEENKQGETENGEKTT